MKTTLDIPEELLNEVLVYSQSSSKKSAVITAMKDYIQRKKMEKFTRHLGNLDGFITSEELQSLRRKR